MMKIVRLTQPHIMCFEPDVPLPIPTKSRERPCRDRLLDDLVVVVFAF